MEEIIIRIGKGGKVNLNVNGIKGQSCKDLTKNLEKSLGSVTETQSTQEYFEQEVQTNNKQNLGGGNNY